MSTKIKYDNKVLAFSKGDKFDIHCKDRKMTSDITVLVDGEESIPEGYLKPEGSLEVSENGEQDVAAYAKVNVNVPIPEGYLKPEGTLDVSENGEQDVAAYAKVNVNVPIPGGYIKPEGNLEISENNSEGIDVSKYASVTVQVSNTGKPTEISSESEMENLLAAASSENVGTVYKYTGESTAAYEKGALYIVEVAE